MIPNFPSLHRPCIRSVLLNGEEQEWESVTSVKIVPALGFASSSGRMGNGSVSHTTMQGSHDEAGGVLTDSLIRAAVESLRKQDKEQKYESAKRVSYREPPAQLTGREFKKDDRIVK